MPSESPRGRKDPIPGHLQPGIIRDHLHGRTEGAVFLGKNGHAISSRTVQHIFNLYAPPGITPHKIRHSYASELYKRSHNLRVVQENLGHNSIQTTEIYIHTDLDERRKAYQEYFPLSTAGEILSFFELHSGLLSHLPTPRGVCDSMFWRPDHSKGVFEKSFPQGCCQGSS
mgnify:CR=1 FL=1